MNVSASKHSAEEAEQWARAMCLAAGGDPDLEIGNPKAPTWRCYEPTGRLALLARDMIAAGAPLKTELF